MVIHFHHLWVKISVVLKLVYKNGFQTEELLQNIISSYVLTMIWPLLYNSFTNKHAFLNSFNEFRHLNLTVHILSYKISKKSLERLFLI